MKSDDKITILKELRQRVFELETDIREFLRHYETDPLLTENMRFRGIRYLGNCSRSISDCYISLKLTETLM